MNVVQEANEFDEREVPLRAERWNDEVADGAGEIFGENFDGERGEDLRVEGRVGAERVDELQRPFDHLQEDPRDLVVGPDGNIVVGAFRDLLVQHLPHIAEVVHVDHVGEQPLEEPHDILLAGTDRSESLDGVEGSEDFNHSHRNGDGRGRREHLLDAQNQQLLDPILPLKLCELHVRAQQRREEFFNVFDDELTEEDLKGSGGWNLSVVAVGQQLTSLSPSLVSS